MAGRFSFVALPAGRYMLSANKQGYVPVSYGARRPNRPGTALVLADAQRIAGMTLRMTRGSVISGIIVDQNGDPFSGANVSVMRNAFVGNGQRTLVAANTVQSDDRGQYRAGVCRLASTWCRRIRDSSRPHATRTSLG